jgi:hypothetical protein
MLRMCRTLLVVFVAVTLPACGYSLAGRGSFLPEHIRTIGVPLFVNNTPVFEIEQRFTDRVRSELIGRGRYTVEPRRTDVDAVLLGEIQSITLVVAALNEQQVATRYSLTIVMKVEFRDVKNDKVIWSNNAWPFTDQFEVTNVTSGTVTADVFLGQDITAQERLAAEFARALVSAILEAF